MWGHWTEAPDKGEVELLHQAAIQGRRRRLRSCGSPEAGLSPGLLDTPLSGKGQAPGQQEALKKKES